MTDACAALEPSAAVSDVAGVEERFATLLKTIAGESHILPHLTLSRLKVADKTAPMSRDSCMLQALLIHARIPYDRDYGRAIAVDERKNLELFLERLVSEVSKLAKKPRSKLAQILRQAGIDVVTVRVIDLGKSKAAKDRPTIAAESRVPGSA